MRATCPAHQIEFLILCHTYQVAKVLRYLELCFPILNATNSTKASHLEAAKLMYVPFQWRPILASVQEGQTTTDRDFRLQFDFTSFLKS